MSSTMMAVRLNALSSEAGNAYKLTMSHIVDKFVVMESSPRTKCAKTIIKQAVMDVPPRV